MCWWIRVEALSNYSLFFFFQNHLLPGRVGPAYEVWFASCPNPFPKRKRTLSFSEDRMLLFGCLETRYFPARDAGHLGVIEGSDRAHLQGTGAGVFENFMRKGRGQQPLWPSAGINCWYKSLEPRKHEEKAKKWNRVGREGEGRLKKWRTESEQSSGEWECSSQWS